MKQTALPGLLLAAVVGAGCLVEIKQVSDPRPAFDQARTEALRYQGRPGPAHQLNVLAFDRDEERLVRVSVPLWLVRKIGAEAGADEDLDFEGPEGGRVARKIHRHVRLEDIEKAGLGILVEAEEEDGGQVLVWLR